MINGNGRRIATAVNDCLGLDTRPWTPWRIDVVTVEYPDQKPARMLLEFTWQLPLGQNASHC